MSLKKSVIHGVAWTSMSNIAGFAINFILGVWLARILGPGAYGLIGMVLVITGFARLLLDFGFSEALVQNSKTTDEVYSSVFWLNLIISIVLTAGVFFAAPLIADFYSKNELIPLCRVLSVTFIANGLSLVQRTRLEKGLRFKEIGIAEVCSSLVAVVFALILAHQNKGVWALVALHITKPVVYNLVVWAYSRWMPQIRFNLHSIKHLTRFSSALFMNGLLGTTAMNLDKLLIGRSLGEVNLGVYTKSFSTVRMPIDQMMSAVGRVMFPAYSSIQNDKNRIYSIYKRVVLLCSTLLFPIMVVFYFFSYEIIEVMFGDQWMSMVPLFTVLSLAIGFLPYNIMADGVIKSQGRVDLINWITYIEKPMAIGAVLIGLSFGSIQAVVNAISINIFLVFLFKSFLITKCLGVPVSDLYFTHLKAIRIVFLPIAALLALKLFGTNNQLIVRIIITVATMIVSALLLRRSTLYPLLDFVRSLKPTLSKK